MSSKQSWDTVSLIELIDSNRPITYGILKPGPDIEDGVPYVRVVDLQGGEVQSSQIRRTTTDIAHQYRRSTLKAGDVLMSIRGHVGRCGVVPTSLIGANITQDTARLAVNGKCDSRFLLWCLRSPEIQRWMAKHTKGVAVTGINLGDVKQIPIPLPTLSEQKRIAGILDQADGLRRKRQQALALTDQFLRSTFLDLFGDPVTNPKRWPVGTIRDLVTNVNYGTSAKAGEHGKYPVLRMNNLTFAGGWNLADLKYMDLAANETDKFMVRKGDLLFNRTNSKELVGKSAVFRESQPMAFAGYLIRIRPNDRANTEYLAGYLNSASGKSKLSHMCKSIVGMANINAQELQNIPIAIPSRELQDRYAAIVDRTHQQTLRYQRGIDECDALFNSLVQRAFRGEL